MTTCSVDAMESKKASKRKRQKDRLTYTHTHSHTCIHICIHTTTCRVDAMESQKAEKRKREKDRVIRRAAERGEEFKNWRERKAAKQQQQQQEDGQQVDEYVCMHMHMYVQSLYFSTFQLSEYVHASMCVCMYMYACDICIQEHIHFIRTYIQDASEELHSHALARAHTHAHTQIRTYMHV
jgi:hypothetical protein